MGTIKINTPRERYQKGPKQHRADEDHVPSTKEILFAPEEQSAGNKRQRQETDKDREGEKNKGEGRDVCPRKTKHCL